MNFRGYIALPLENKAKNIMAKNGINGVTVSADAIEYGSFVSVMAFLLYVELGNSEEVLCFLRKSAKYLGSSANEMEINYAYELYKMFESLLSE